MRETTNILLDTYKAEDKTSWLTTYNENLEKVDLFAGTANSRIQQNETNITTINNEIELIKTNIATLSEAGTGNSSSISELQNSLRDTNENVLANTNKNNLQDQEIININNRISNLHWKVKSNIIYHDATNPMSKTQPNPINYAPIGTEGTELLGRIFFGSEFTTGFNGTLKLYVTDPTIVGKSELSPQGNFFVNIENEKKFGYVYLSNLIPTNSIELTFVMFDNSYYITDMSNAQIYYQVPLMRVKFGQEL